MKLVDTEVLFERFRLLREALSEFDLEGTHQYMPNLGVFVLRYQHQEALCLAKYSVGHYTGRPNWQSVKLNSGKEILIPVSELITEDRGEITVSFDDTFFVGFTNLLLAFLKSEANWQTNPKGRGEYLLPRQGNFSDHLKSLTRFNRAWKKCKDVQCSKGLNFSSCTDIFQSNTRYFAEKIKSDLSDWSVELFDRAAFIEKTYFPGLGINTSKIFRHSIEVTSYFLQGNIVGYSLAENLPNERYWINSIFLRNEVTSKLQLGNFMILKELDTAYFMGKPLNLGLDVFEYKKLWNPVHIFKETLN